MMKRVNEGYYEVGLDEIMAIVKDYLIRKDTRVNSESDVDIISSNSHELFNLRIHFTETEVIDTDKEGSIFELTT